MSGGLVEREAELRSLDTALAGALEGTGTVTLIEGAPGLGKSVLLAEVGTRARGRGLRTLRATALASETEYAFAVVLALFEGPLAELGKDERRAVFAGAAALARPVLGGEQFVADGDAGSSLFPSLHGLYWLVVNLTALGPLVICVDDLQWSDPPSLRFLLYLAERVEELPIALIFSARPPGAGGEGDALARLRARGARGRIELRPLGPESVLSLLRAAIPNAEQPLAMACAEVTGGNPFYVHEVMRTVAEDGPESGAHAAEALRGLAGTAIARAALSRLARAGPDAVALGRALAILGDEAPLRQAAELAELDLAPAAAAADALADEDVLAGGEPLAFVHRLVRDQIYGEIGAQQRGIAHARAARILAADGVAPELIAAQLLPAPGAGDSWAVERLRDAARSASTHGATDSAARHLQRALEEPPPLEHRRAVHVELGEALLASGRADAAAEELKTALQLDAGPCARIETRRRLAAALLAAGRAGEAAHELELAIAEAADDDPDLTAGLLADHLGAAAFEPGLRQRSFELLAPLRSAVPSTGSTTAQRRLLAAMATRAAQEAEPAERVIELAGRAWSAGALLDDEGPDGTGWLMVFWALALAEDYAQARAVTAATIDAARRAGSVHAFANASYYHGDSCYREGSLLDAQADAEQAIAAGESGWRRFLAGALVLKANVLIERGELEAAAETLVAAEEHELGNMLGSAWRLHACGRLALARGEPEPALRDLEEAGRWLSERLAVTHTVLPWRADAALAALALGDRDRARALIEPEIEAATRAGTEAMRGRRLRLLGLIEGGEVGIELLRQATDCLEGTQARLEHAHALADLGAALRRAGRRTEARPPLEQALDRAHRLGASRLEARVREELGVLGLRPRRPQTSGPDALTPSQRRVAGLAADGLTNPQIAQALFITQKTVEFHLRHVYAKLNISGRADLAGVLPARETAGRKD